MGMTKVIGRITAVLAGGHLATALMGYVDPENLPSTPEDFLLRSAVALFISATCMFLHTMESPND